MSRLLTRRERRELKREHADQERESYDLADETQRDEQIPDDYCNVYLLFNLEAAVAEGHTVLGLTDKLNGPMTTYSFYRHGNKLRAPGLMAQLEHPETLDDLDQASGWLIQGNPGNYWNEHMNAALSFAVPPAAMRPIKAYADKATANPPEYDLVKYNCLTFAMDALKKGGVTLEAISGRDLHTIIPKDAFEDIIGAEGAEPYGKWKYWFPNTEAPKNGLTTIPDIPGK
ncbi:hypothetical protein [Bifidobacterium choloepi]|uniref:DUF4105 domain-containing protein n=1 Tax=Bifidobacterium choloepi TaxID=2614131 RepID=A0A6I5MZC3_9BIFI|nr:hypothetical protein [Bifidobacterium choloepi]NEG69175.1 hypothetical protein [Bifidobacterium choloepi]